MAAPIYDDTQVSAGGYLHTLQRIRSYPPPSILSANSENTCSSVASNERPSIELKISSSGAEILNAVVVLCPSGRPLYSISSNKNRTKLLSHKDDAEVATIDWNRSSPRMVFRGKKIKCKDWLPRAAPETEYELIAPFRSHRSPL